MRGRVSFRRSGSRQVWSEEDQQMVLLPWPPHYEGPARVLALTGEARRVVTADDTEIVVDYLFQISHDVNNVRPGQLVEVLEGDPSWQGTARVMQVVTGTERFTRDVFAVLID